MNYIDLINQFWQKDIEFDFVDKEIALYFYLLKVSNSIGWKNPFGLSNSMTIAKFNWGKTSFDTAKNRLKKAGLIDFKPGDGRGNVYQYELKKVIVKGAQKIPLSTILSTTLSDTLSKSKPATSINSKQKLKQKNVIGHSPPTKLVFKPPDLRQVQDYFVSAIGNSKNKNPWPTDKCFNEAATLLDHYTANGWVQSRGKKIIDWKAACRNWIRNDLKGAFSNVKSAPVPKPAVHAKTEHKPDKVQSEIDYLLERFIEDENKVTIISIETEHYNYLKRHGLISFSEEEKAEIKKLTITKLNGDVSEQKVLDMMKRIGVIEYFKKIKTKKLAII